MTATGVPLKESREEEREERPEKQWRGGKRLDPTENKGIPQHKLSRYHITGLNK